MKIQCENDKYILIDFCGDCQHEKVEPKSQIRAKERRNLGVQLMASGTQNVRNEHIIHNMISMQILFRFLCLSHLNNI